MLLRRLSLCLQSQVRNQLRLGYTTSCSFSEHVVVSVTLILKLVNPLIILLMHVVLLTIALIIEAISLRIVEYFILWHSVFSIAWMLLLCEVFIVVEVLLLLKLILHLLNTFIMSHFFSLRNHSILLLLLSGSLLLLLMIVILKLSLLIFNVCFLLSRLWL